MRFSGQHIIDRGREELFEKLLDPAVIMKCIPGCEELVRTPDGNYQARVGAKIGLFRASFAGRVVLREVVRPERYSMDLEFRGKLGSMTGALRIDLRPLDGPRTEVGFEGEILIGGLMATVGERLVPGGSGEFPRQFFAALERALEEGE